MPPLPFLEYLPRSICLYFYFIGWFNITWLKFLLHVFFSRSGTEEEWAELKRLLQDVIVLSREFNGPENTYSPRTAQNRDASSALDLLKERHKDEKIMKRAEIEIKSKQLKLDEETLSYQKENLELEKQRLELERKKFELECKEREVRLQMEMEEREDRLQADREQRQILMSLLKKILEK